MPRLFVVTPRGNVDLVELDEIDGGSLSLGRGVENGLSFPEDRGLSRHHLVLEHERDRWSVRDLDSKNGTFVNGKRLTGPKELQPGDRVTASHVTLTYQEPETSRRRVAFEPLASFASETVSLEELLAREAGIPPADRRPFGFFVHAGRELARHRSLPELFGVILDLCLEGVPAERGVLLTVDERGQLEMQASRGEGIRISQTVRDTVLREKRAMLVANAPTDTRVRESDAIGPERVQSVLAAPLQSDERIIGLVYVDTLEPRRAFSRRDLEVFTALANVAGLRIELGESELKTRELIAENARNLSRLTAGLSHELNNPLGALKSSLDSLWRLAQSGRSLPEDEKKRIESVQSDLRATLDASLGRMQEVIARIQRFANLDRAETRCVDLNETLADVIALLQPTETFVTLELVPGARVGVSCHPQPLSGALSSLVAFSVEACRETGGKRVKIDTTEHDGRVDVRILREGGSFTPDQLDRLFEPTFEVAGGRVAARTWSLFSAREIVRAQGGEVRSFSGSAGETGFVVTLPVPREVS